MYFTTVKCYDCGNTFAKHTNLIKSPCCNSPLIDCDSNGENEDEDQMRTAFIESFDEEEKLFSK